jgi:hypothetical protein
MSRYQTQEIIKLDLELHQCFEMFSVQQAVISYDSVVRISFVRVNEIGINVHDFREHRRVCVSASL